MVEAPGYCPPGPKCLFHLTVYRHSRLPGPLQIGRKGPNLKVRAKGTGTLGNDLGKAPGITLLLEEVR